MTNSEFARSTGFIGKSGRETPSVPRTTTMTHVSSPTAIVWLTSVTCRKPEPLTPAGVETVKLAPLLSTTAGLTSQALSTEPRNENSDAQAGFEFVYDAASNLNEVNWAPIVVAMRNEDVEYVTLTSSWEEGANLQKAMVEQGFAPTFFDLEANYYNDKYPKAAGPAADGTLARITIWPFEEADENAAMTAYLDALRATNGDDVVPELLGVQSFSSALLFAQAVKAPEYQLRPLAVFALRSSSKARVCAGLLRTMAPVVGIVMATFIVPPVPDQDVPLPNARVPFAARMIAGVAAPALSWLPIRSHWGPEGAVIARLLRTCNRCPVSAEPPTSTLPPPRVR